MSVLGTCLYSQEWLPSYNDKKIHILLQYPFFFFGDCTSNYSTNSSPFIRNTHKLTTNSKFETLLFHLIWFL